MTRRNRTLRLIAMLVVLAGTLVSLVAPAILVQAQDDADPAARPPEFPIEILLGDQYFSSTARSQLRSTGCSR